MGCSGVDFSSSSSARDQSAGVRTWPALVGREDETGVSLARDEQRLGEWAVVAHVLGDDSSTVRSSVVEHLLVRCSGPWRLVNRDGVMPASP